MCSWHLSAAAHDAFRLIVTLGDKLMKEKHTLLEWPLKMQCFPFSKQLLPFGGSFIMGMLRILNQPPPISPMLPAKKKKKSFRQEAIS